jgi:hypothetical protein
LRKAQAEAISHQIAVREGANWDTIGAIAEILGAAGVIITAMCVFRANVTADSD